MRSQLKSRAMPHSSDALIAALRTVVDAAGVSIVDAGLVKEAADADGRVAVTLDVGEGNSRAAIGSRVRETLLALGGVERVDIRWRDDVPGRAIAADDPMPGVKHIILVMSGKGGVGKSTTATNLTLALHRLGYRVGLLDADIYGPSIPTMLGISGRPVSTDGKHIEPLERFGVKLMSIGFLLEDPKQAVIWRGPMLTGALQQFMKDVQWGNLDFLVFDLPPGTGDVALSLSQRVRSTGAVVVTTPQNVATDDVFKSVSMAQKLEIPVLGVVENMSYFLDPAGIRHEIFGKGGGQAVADFAGAPLLGQLPIDTTVREWGDKGTPVVQAMPQSPIAQMFIAIAERLVDTIAEGAEDTGLPTIDRSGGQGRVRLPMAK
jgi:ATP-binding protein involved in chromosome partitioning